MKENELYKASDHNMLPHFFEYNCETRSSPHIMHAETLQKPRQNIYGPLFPSEFVLTVAAVNKFCLIKSGLRVVCSRES